MKAKHTPSAYRALLPTLFCSTLLVACGSSETKTASSSDSTMTAAPEATALTTAHTSLVNLQARADASELDITDNGSELVISIRYSDVVTAEHSQVFLNTDNNTATGFGFYQEAWGGIGADYMIQDRYLYRALSNNAAWDWEPVAEVSNYTNTGKQINMVVSKSLMGSPCGEVQAGVMGRNGSWGVEVMYPVATSLAAVSIASCTSDTTAPEVTLNDSTTLSVTQGSVFNDPGATAIDDVDGDISSGIQVIGSVDTSTTGTYTLAYQAMDSSGNVGQSPTRTVTVTAATALVSPGLLDSWDVLINKASLDTGSDTSKQLDLYQDSLTNNLYLDLNWTAGSRIGHTQLFLNTDNATSTGYQAWSGTSTAPETGAEFMIEDGQLYQYTGSGIDWSWSGPMSLAYFFDESCSGSSCGDWTTEMKVIIPSSVLNGSTLSVLALHLSEDWTSNLIFANDSRYTLTTP